MTDSAVTTHGVAGHHSEELRTTPDVYAIITEVDPAAVEQVANVMESARPIRSSRPWSRATSPTSPFPPGARVLEIGCGTGAICRQLAALPDVGEVLGVDPSPILLAKGRELAAGIANLSFQR